MVNNVLSKNEMISFIHNNYKLLKLDKLEKGDIEVIFIITTFLSDNINMKKYSLNRLKLILSKTPVYRTKYKYLKTFFCCIFLLYILNSIGFFTMIHEIFGHLYIGGSLLTEPPFRYTISYPSKYYQIDGYDKYIIMDKSIKNYFLLISGFLKIDNVTRLNDYSDGIAFPFLDMKKYSPYYKSLGVNQSIALLYISGLFPIYIISISTISISFYFKKYIRIILLILSGFLYGVEITSIIDYIINKNNSSESKDIKMFSKYYHNYNETNSIKYYETVTICSLILVYPIIFISNGLLYKINSKKYIPIDKIMVKIFNNNNQYILDRINNISKKNLRYQIKSFTKNSNQIKEYNRLYKNIINCIKVEDVLKLYNYYIFNKKLSNFFYILDFIKKGLIINIIIIPFLNAYLYNTYYISIVNYLPMLLFIIYISEFLLNDLIHYFIIKNNSLLNTSTFTDILTFLEFLFLIICFSLSILYMINYEITEIKYLWGYFYTISMYVLTSFANLCKYNKMKIIFQKIPINLL